MVRATKKGMYLSDSVHKTKLCLTKVLPDRVSYQTYTKALRDLTVTRESLAARPK